MNFGEKIKKVRLSKDWTQDYLAKAASQLRGDKKITQQVIQALEDRKSMKSIYAADICKALGIRLNWAVFNTGPQWEREADPEPPPQLVALPYNANWRDRVNKMIASNPTKKYDLAHALAISDDEFDEILADAREPSLAQLLAIARGLGKKLSQLVGDDDGEYDDMPQFPVVPTHKHRAGELFYPVPQLDVAASMGSGIFAADHAEVVASISVYLNDLRKQATFSAPQNLRFITGYGHSMEPTYKDGDVLLVDVGITTVDVDAVYVFRLGAESSLFIKTLQRKRDGSLLMVSHNRQAYEPEVIPVGEPLTICGRVVLAWNARRL